jgi:hypothetical protein
MCADTRVDRHLMLPGFNQNLNVLSNFNKTLQYH